MLEDSVIKKVLSEALARGGEFAEIFAEDRSSTALNLEGSKVEDVVRGARSRRVVMLDCS